MTNTRNPREAALEAVAEAARNYLRVQPGYYLPEEQPLVDAFKALDALPAADGGWRPIAEAPKDGTKVDLWVAHSPDRATFDGRETDCRWADGTWQRYDDKSDEWAEVEQIEPLRDGGWWRATHWQPLPPPPVPQSAEEP